MKNKLIYFVILIIALVAVGFCIGYVASSWQTAQKVSGEGYQMPMLNLSLKYFSNDDFEGMSGGNSNDPKTWDYAIVNIDGSRSAPTTKITLSRDIYNSTVRNLPPVIPYKPVTDDPEGVWDQLHKKTLQEYGSIVDRFWSGGESIYLKHFDVDGDKKDETIVYACGIGANHCPDQIFVIKNDKIIFSAQSGWTGLDLAKSDSGDGFYIHWVPSENVANTKWDTGLANMPGYMNTRFVLADNQFVPIYEQEVMYFEAKNTK